MHTILSNPIIVNFKNPTMLHFELYDALTSFKNSLTKEKSGKEQRSSVGEKR